MEVGSSRSWCLLAKESFRQARRMTGSVMGVPGHLITHGFGSKAGSEGS